MRPRIEGSLSCHDVQRMAFGWVQEHLRLPDRGRKCAASVVLSVLLFAAARCTSIFRACQRLRDAPGDQALRNALVRGLPNLAELQRRLNRSLVASIPGRVTRRPRPWAIDLVLIPYHGSHFADPAEIVRGPAKGGTTHFHAYATCYVVRRGHRYTIAITRVEQGEPLEEVVGRLLRIARRSGLKCQYLLLDRGFYETAVIRYLQAARVPFLMPVVHRGRPPRDPAKSRSTRRFLRWRRSGFDRHTIVPARGRRVTVGICVSIRNLAGRFEGRRGRKVLVYAFWGLPRRSHRWFRDAYRLRFGIETSYRQMHEGRIRTCTRNPAHRLLFVALALVLRNLWVWLHSEVIARPRRGGRLFRPERLRLRDLYLLLDQGVQHLLNLVDHITLTDSPQGPK